MTWPRKRRPRYGVYFVDPASNRYSALISVIINAIDYNIWPRYCENLLEIPSTQFVSI